jgi:hypothetical protein
MCFALNVLLTLQNPRGHNFTPVFKLSELFTDFFTKKISRAESPPGVMAKDRYLPWGGKSIFATKDWDGCWTIHFET